MKKHPVWTVLIIGSPVWIFVLAMFPGLREVLVELLFGWSGFLGRALPQTRTQPWSLVVAAVSLVLLTAGLHFAGRWLMRELRNRTADGAHRWKAKWTLTTIAVVMLTFVAGTAVIGIVHQTGWLLASSEPRWGKQVDSQFLKQSSKVNLRQIGIGVQIYHEVYEVLPPAGTFNSSGEGQKSWAAQLLPFVGANDFSALYSDNPWNHPDNFIVYRSIIPEFINPEFRTTQLYDADGYALMHYAANVHIMGPNRSISPSATSDGARQTLLIGEVNQNFKPWGDPSNWRDPIDGINKSPNSFGGASSTGGAQFLCTDGSTRFVNDDIDPDVLKSLSVPSVANSTGKR